MARFGVAHTPSPDARVGHPALWLARHWLRSAILAPLATDAVSRGVGNPSLVTRRGASMRCVWCPVEAQRRWMGWRCVSQALRPRAWTGRRELVPSKPNGVSRGTGVMWLVEIVDSHHVTAMPCGGGVTRVGLRNVRSIRLSACKGQDGFAGVERAFRLVHQAKCAKALFASAMRCTLSRLVTAAPSRL